VEGEREGVKNSNRSSVERVTSRVMRECVRVSDKVSEFAHSHTFPQINQSLSTGAKTGTQVDWLADFLSVERTDCGTVCTH